MLIFLLLTVTGQATTYYVNANSGDDSNNGTSLATSWATSGKACTASVISPGDSILMTGTFTDSLSLVTSGADSVGTFVPTVSGTSGNVVYYGPIPDSSRPEIRSFGSDYDHWGVVFCSNIAYVTIDGFTQKKTRRGISTFDCSNITIQYVTVCSTGNVGANGNNAGICAPSHDFDCYSPTVYACTLFYNNETPTVTETDHNSGGFLTYNWYNGIIRRNVIHTSEYGIGVMLKEGNHHILVDSNTITNMNASGVMLYNNCDSSTVCFNTIIGGGAAVVFEGQYFDLTPILTYTGHDAGETQYFNYENLVYNNTFYTSNDGVFEEESAFDQHDNEIFNNISVANTYPVLRGNSFTTETSLYMDYNCYYQLTGSVVARWSGTNYTALADFVAAVNVDSNSVHSYPVFADSANHDFSLTAGSPAAVKTGGRGGSYPSYMGAVAPAAASTSKRGPFRK